MGLRVVFVVKLRERDFAVAQGPEILKGMGQGRDYGTEIVCGTM